MLSIKSAKNPAFTSAHRVLSSSEQPAPRKPSLGKSSKQIPEMTDRFKSESAGMPTGAPNTGVSYNQITVDLDPMLTGIGPNSSKPLFALYKDIYYNDSVAGSAVDLISSLPFSEFTLGGISDPKIAATFNEVIERMNVRTLLPELSIDYLVYGAHVSSMLYNREKKVFTDVMCHALEHCSFEELPFYSQDPIITVDFTESAKTLRAKRDHPRIKRLVEMVGQTVVDSILKGSIELEPLNTLYIPRRTFSSGQLGTSFFKRILPIYLIEKNLFRGTLMESARRQRGIMHITAGDGDQWEPTEQDLEFITELFMNADSDPLGAIIATKMGIAIEEIRQGGDFWKVTDFQDSVMTHKYHALGISDGLLSGEANYNCVIGSTYIQTEKGIRQIQDIASRKEGDVQDYTDFVNSRFGRARSAKWLYSGFAPTIEVNSCNGSSLTGTPKHRILTLTETLDLEWTTLKSLKVGDLLAQQTKPFVRTKKLKLSLPDAVKVFKGVRKEAIKPKTMTPTLAFLMGAIVAEGSINTQRIAFPNSNVKFLDAVANAFKDVFGIDAGRSLRHAKGTKHVIYGVHTETTADHYVCYVNSKTVVTWLNELGLDSATSYNKKVPWSILQADVESQYAFLAGLIEGDGSVHKHSGKISIASMSKELISGVAAMLQAMGLCVSVSIRKKTGLNCLSLHKAESYSLHQNLKPYIVSKSFDFKEAKFKNANSFGIPGDYVRQFLKSRNLGFCNKGNSFLDDAGNTVTVTGYKQLGDKSMLYDAYEAGKYDVLLAIIHKISPSFHKKVVELLKLRYKFTKVVAKADMGKQHVYDLSMNPFVEPAYVANGFISHNTADASLTVFIDMIRTYREMITRKFFYNKLFPLVSLINGYTVNAKGKVTQRDLLGELTGADLMTKLNDGSKLLTPTVNWAKQLKPEGDTAYMDMLNTLAEKGVPVPIRVLAAAGGLNLDELLRQSDDDIDNRKRISEYVKKISALAPKPAEGAEDESLSSDYDGNEAAIALASSDPTGKVRSAVLAVGKGKVPLLNREFGSLSEVYATTKTGKRKAVYNQSAENERVNRLIARSANKLNTLNAKR